MTLSMLVKLKYPDYPESFVGSNKDTTGVTQTDQIEGGDHSKKCSQQEGKHQSCRLMA